MLRMIADARRAMEEHRLMGPDPGAGGQDLDPTLLDARLTTEVEVAQGDVQGKPGELRRGADPPHDFQRVPPWVRPSA